MSQSRVRKAPAESEAGKTRVSIVKASGDTVPCTRPKEQDRRSRSKNKLPKSIRYDLDNALVGLCDVWFEEIKPHLVRNNIKLHVDGSTGPAGGDHGYLPAETPGCSHLDPAASANECKLCRLLFNAANSIGSAVSQASAASSAGPASAASIVASNTSNNSRFDVTGTRHNISFRASSHSRFSPFIILVRRHIDTSPSLQNKASKRQSPIHCRRLVQSSPDPRRESRLSRTNSILSTAPSPRTIMKRIGTLLPLLPASKPFGVVHVPSFQTHEKSRNKWCQTDPVPILITRRPRSSAKQHAVVKINNLDSIHSKLSLNLKTTAFCNKNQHHHVSKLNKSLAKYRPVVNSIPIKPKPSKSNRQISFRNRPPFTQNRGTFSYKGAILQESKPCTVKRPTQHSRPRTSRTRNIPLKNIRNSPQNQKLFPQNKENISQKSSFPAQNLPRVYTRALPRITSPMISDIKLTPAQLGMFIQVKSKLPNTRPESCERSAITAFRETRNNNQDRPSRSLKREKAKGVDGKFTELPALFDNDLINIIGEKNDKRLRLLFQSPHRMETSSMMMNLYPSPSDRENKVRRKKKSNPWR